MWLIHNPAIVAALVRAGAQVVYVEEERQSLEEAYLHLVREEGPQ